MRQSDYPDGGIWTWAEVADVSDQQNAELKAEVEKLREQLEAAKVALEKVDGECPYGDCSCKLLHTVARKALARIEEDK
jgi:uncharacterized protein YhaN